MKKSTQIQSFSLLILSLIAITLSLRAYGIRINFTSSMPRGIYLKSTTGEIARGDIVSACLPVKVANEGMAKGYLSHGSCPGSHAMPVLKEVVAISGDKIFETVAGLLVNQHFHYAPMQPNVLTQNAELNFLIQTMRATTERYWLYGTHNEVNSWDSRYYGGLKREVIQGIFKPLWTF